MERAMDSAHFIDDRPDLLRLRGGQLQLGRDLLAGGDGQEPFTLQLDLGQARFLALIQDLGDRGVVTATDPVHRRPHRIRIHPFLATCFEGIPDFLPHRLFEPPELSFLLVAQAEVRLH